MSFGFAGKGLEVLLIINATVELRDAAHLWGKSVREAEGILRQELRQHKVEMLIIGPAGENRSLRQPSNIPRVPAPTVPASGWSWGSKS